MLESQLQPKAQLHLGGVPVGVLGLLLTATLAVGGGYGGARYAAGEQNRINADLERQLQEHRAEMERVRQSTISKEQFDLLLRMVGDMRGDMTSIRSDIRDLNNRR